jgi:hypothetical protein
MVVPDMPSAPDEVAALRMANARLRQVIEAKDTEMLVLREQLEVLRAEVAELRARLGASSRNSSKPPSADGAWPAGLAVAAGQVRARAWPAEGPAGRDAGDDRRPGSAGTGH